MTSNYFTAIWCFESEKCGKEGKKLQKFEYLDNKKSYLDEITSFWRANICEKVKNSRDNL